MLQRMQGWSRKGSRETKSLRGRRFALALNSARRYCRSNMHFVFLSRFLAVSSTEVERLLDHHLTRPLQIS